MTIQIPGLDVEKGLDLYDGEMDIYVAVLRSYISNTPAVLDRLRSVSSETLSDYAIAVHGMKGTSSNIGAENIMKEAKELELLAKAGDLQGVLSRSDAFLKRADALVDNIKSWLKHYDAQS